MKLGTSTCFIVAFLGCVSAMSVGTLTSLLVFVAAWVLPVNWIAGGMIGFRRIGMRLILPTYVMLLLVYCVLWPRQPDEQTYRFSCFVLRRDGLVTATMIAGRLTAIFGMTYALSSWASPREMADGMRKLGVPAPAAAAFMASFAMLDLVKRRTRQIVDAQRSRGLQTTGNPIRKLFNLVPLIRPLVYSMILAAVDRAFVWGHRGMLSVPIQRNEGLTLIDFVAIALAVCVLAACVAERCLL